MTLSPALSTPSNNPYAPPRPYSAGARKIKVLLISHTCQSRTEGQPKAHALAALPDIDLHLLTPARWLHYGQWRDAQPPLNPQFAVTIAPVRLAWFGPAQYFLHTYPALPRLLREFQPDIIDLWEEPWSRISAQACRLRNKLFPKTKIISETEQNIFKNLPFPFERYRTFTLKNIDFVVGRNSESIAHLRTKGYAGPAEVVPNAVDTSLFRPLDRAACRAALLRELETGSNVVSGASPLARQPGTFFAGYVGRLVPEKGLLDLLNALPLCPPGTHLLFLGDGPLAPALRQRAAEITAQLNPANAGAPHTPRIHFLPARPLEQLPQIMNALDAFVLPSLTTARWKEQFGRVLIEAAACQTPCIGTTSGAIPDVIADSGLLIPEHDPAALARAITQLHDNPTLAQTLGNRGHHNALAYFTWQRIAERMAMIYQIATTRAPG